MTLHWKLPFKDRKFVSFYVVFCNFYSTSNVGEFSHDVRMLAALNEDKNAGGSLLDAAKRLAGAFSDLLTAAQPNARDVSHPGL